RLFTKATAIQHAKDKIRCNSVHPGPIATDMIKEMLENTSAWEQRLRRLPMGRVGTPQEVAYGVLYLASDEASYVTGSELVIDGGTTAEGSVSSPTPSRSRRSTHARRASWASRRAVEPWRAAGDRAGASSCARIPRRSSA